MVYKGHQEWRDIRKIDSSVWNTRNLPSNHRKLVTNMRKSKPAIPYTLEIECNSYWGNFEREFLGYSIGILDDVQMDIDHSDEERALFWKEVFGKEPITFKEAFESYDLYKDYLLETFQECDDWEQLTFYAIDWDTMHKENRNVLKVQLAKPFSKEWEEIIIPRMKDFFTCKIYPYMEADAKLIGVVLYDHKGEVVKEY